MTMETIKLVGIRDLTYFFSTIYLPSPGRSSGVRVNMELFKF